MAKVRNNIITHGLSGSLGDQIVFRAGKDGQTIVATKSAFDREFNAAQLAQQDAFRQAVLYAKSARDETIYITKAQGTPLSAFNVAVVDWFNKPQVLEIDAIGWTGEVGQTIRIKAQDDTLVSSVRVVITDSNGAVVEQGNAVQSDGLWWNYTTTTVIEDSSPVIQATVEDLPGNSGQLSWQNN